MPFTYGTPLGQILKLIVTNFSGCETGTVRVGHVAAAHDSPAEIEGMALEGLIAQHLRAWVRTSFN